MHKFFLAALAELIHQDVTPRPILHSLTVNSPVDCSVRDILRLSLFVLK